MEKPISYIHKTELVDGAEYYGFCRNAITAIWNAKEDSFVHIRYKFGYRLEDIEHFDDVKETGGDGFVPLIKLKSVYGQPWLEEFLKEIGYH